MGLTRLPGILAVGAEDSCGLQGLSVYSRSASALGAHVLPVAACVLARRESSEVRAIHTIAPSMIARQMDGCVRCFRVGAVILGMLARYQAVGTVARRISRRELDRILLVPEVGESGEHTMLNDRGILHTTRSLVPRSELVVCDRETAEALSGVQVRGAAGFDAASESLVEAGAGWALMLGVRRSGRTVSLLTGPETLQFEAEVDNPALRDILVTAIAVEMASGASVPESVESAHRHLARGLVDKVFPVGVPEFGSGSPGRHAVPVHLGDREQ